MGQKKNSLYLSNFPNENKKIDQFIITESPEDCMAHYQLNTMFSSVSNVLYGAINGMVTQEQCIMISEIFNQYRISKLILGNDNDIYGAWYNAKILAKFIPESIEHIVCEIICQKKKDISSIMFEMHKQEEYKLVNVVDQYPVEVFQLKEVKRDRYRINILLEFDTSHQNWKTATEILLLYKFGATQEIIIQQPVGDDFSDDIKQ